MPADDSQLETDYIPQDYLDVDTKNNVRVAQTAPAQLYAIHQFKDYIGASSAVNLEWEGQTNQSCTLSPVVLQIYNRNTPAWENVDSDNTTLHDIDFVLSGNIPDTTNYVDASDVISCRVYQLHA